jgi:hypothetical protein
MRLLPVRFESERWHPPRTSTENIGAPDHIAPGGGGKPIFDLVSVTFGEDVPGLESAWRDMLASSQSSEKLYQSVEFFQYLAETSDSDSPPCEIVVVRRSSDKEIVGIVPIRTGTVPVELRLGAFVFFNRRLPVVQLLGSVPMLRGRPDPMPALMHYLLDRFPGHKVVSMQSLSPELHNDFRQRHGLKSYVIHGWRECHAMALPPSFDEYLQKFSSKKRYNLARQVRLLAKELGQLTVTRIDSAPRIAEMFAAMKQIVPPRSYAHISSASKLERLADLGLMLSYVIRCGAEPVAVVVATVACGTWHVHNIFADKKHFHLSVGTSALHLALEDVLTNYALAWADYGYGTPNHEFRSTHVLRSRGHVLLYRSFSRPSLLIGAHRVYDRLYSGVLRRLKQLKRQLDQRRAAGRRPVLAK